MESQDVEAARGLAADIDTAAGSDTTMWSKFAAVETLSLQRELAELGYAVQLTGTMDAGTRRAMALFAARHRIPIQSDTDAAIALGVRVADEAAAEVLLPARRASFYSWAGGYASIDGTWSDSAAPRQTSEITCYRSDRACFEALAVYNDRGLSVSLETYTVDRWDDDQIFARSDALCVRTVLIITRAAKTASLHRSPLLTGGKLCREMGDTVERTFTLLDGARVHDSLATVGARYLLLGTAAREAVRFQDSLLRQSHR